MFEGRAVLYRTIRTLARTIERERARQMAGPQFDAWLDEHCYTGRDLPQGTRSKTIAWSAAADVKRGGAGVGIHRRSSRSPRARW
jgi:hypothetical protein